MNGSRLAQLETSLPWKTALSAVTALLLVAPDLAHGDPPQVSSSVAQCSALQNADLSQLQDAPTQITETKFLDANTDRPESCQIGGYVAPNVGFVLRLPGDWNGKLIQRGCGGYCGSTEKVIEGCNEFLRRGYACIVSEGGHRSTSGDALWAYNNLQAEVDFGYRAPHVTTLAGKALVERYYGRPAARSYFIGTSTGGRQALMEAQRFPWDFDGILAGVPSLGVPFLEMTLLWGSRALLDRASGKALLRPEDLALLHRAVLESCDLNDGIKDGLIGDPRSCAFDPEALRCLGRTTDCLNDPQLQAVSKIYRGPVTSTGMQIYPPGAMRGSELSWTDWFSPNAGVSDEFRYSAFDPDPGPRWNPQDFDFDRDYKRMGVAEGLYSATNPDLRRFKAAGGKLLAYAGWNDAGGMSLPAVDYYEMVERAMGGRVSTQSFFRLFVIPGMNHGPTVPDGVFVVDWLSYLEAWVEKDRAPDELIVSHINLDGFDLRNVEDLNRLERLQRLPTDPATIEFSRPVYPYPIQARYTGHGDPKVAASFRPVNK